MEKQDFNFTAYNLNRFYMAEFISKYDCALRKSYEHKKWTHNGLRSKTIYSE